MSTYRLLLLGAPVLEGPAGPMPLPGRKTQALLWYLTTQPGRALSRAQIAGVLWEDEPETAGRNSLNTMLTRLRHSSPSWPICADRDTVRWDVTSGFEVDVALFLQLTVESRTAAESPAATADSKRLRLAAAVALWRGAFLAGFETPGGELMAEWLDQERRAWEQRFLQVLERLVALDQAAAAWADLAAHARVALAIDPLQERFHRALMVGLHRLGDRGAALAQFTACRRILAAELGVEPAAATTTLRDDIVQGRADTAGPVAGAPPTRVGLRPWSAPAKAAPAVPHPALVGRDQVLDQMSAALGNAARGLCPMVVVCGEAGIGKTRLLQEMLWQSSQPDHPANSVLVGHCFEGAQTIAYAPIVQALSSALPGLELDPALSPTALAEISRLVPELSVAIPDLPTPPVLSPEQERRRLFHAVALLLGSLPNPALLVIEDLHWADEATLQLLGYLVRQPRCRGAAFLITASSGDLPAPVVYLLRQLEREGLATWLQLEPLPVSAMQSLITALTGQADPALGERLYAETRGNPLFAVEILRSWQTGGSPDQTAGSPASSPVPPVLEAVILGRLRRLTAAAQHLAGAAALFPSGVPFPILQTVAAQEQAEALAALDALLRTEFLVEDPVAGTISFRHDLIRKVVADGLSRARSASLHRQAFQALAATAGDPQPAATGGRDSALAEELTYHAMAGGLWEQGLVWAWRAASHARRLCAYQTSIRLLEHALSCMEHLPDSTELRSMALRIRLELCQMTFFSGPEQLRRWAEPAMADARALDDRPTLAQLQLIQADVHMHLGRFPAALEILVQVEDYASQVGDEATLARSHRAQARMLISMGDLARAADLARRAAPALQRLSTNLDAVYVTNLRACSLALQGHLDEAETLLRPLVPRSRSLGDRAAAANALAYLGLVASLRGQWDAAVALCQESIHEARSAGHLGEEYVARCLIAKPLAAQGEGRAALANQDRLAAVARRLGTQFMLGIVRYGLSLAHLTVRDWGRAEEAALDGLRLANEQGARLDQAYCLQALGLARAASGRPQLAQAALTQSLHEFSAMGVRPEVGRCHAALAELALADGMAAHAQAAADLFRELGIARNLGRLRWRSPGRRAQA